MELTILKERVWKGKETGMQENKDRNFLKKKRCKMRKKPLS